MKKLPVLISIPHGGTEEPEELAGRISLGEAEMLGEADAFAREIYDLGNKVARVIWADVARALVDLNRNPERLPPERRDGVIKEMTTYGEDIYKEGKEPGPDLMARLIERYYEPYHDLIREAVEELELELALDCHSMAAVGPTLARDAGEKRPMICLGNVNGESCPDPTLQRLQECFCRAFSLPPEEVSLNSPFAGGYITRSYGMNPVPWAQIEISRAMYFDKPWFDPATMKMDHKRLKELNRMFSQALDLFFE